MSMLRLGGLALGTILSLGACTGQDRTLDSRGSQARPGAAVLQDPLNTGTPGVSNPDRIGGPGSAPGAAAVPGSAGGGGFGGAGRATQGFGAPVR